MKTTMKKSVARVLMVVMVVCLMASLALPAMATELSAAQGLDEVKYGVFKFNTVFEMPAYGDAWIGSRGTAFLINDEYVVTAAHCVRFTESEANIYGYTLNEENTRLNLLKGEVKYSVTVERDMTVGATLVNMSESMDFAILKLDQKIPTRKYLTLRDSKDVKAAEQVYSVGFPAFYDNQNLDSDYTTDDVTIKSGVISKTQGLDNFSYSTGQVCKLDVLTTTCNLGGGDSGGPLVDANGYVVGVSIAGLEESVSDNFYSASAIDQVMRACDNLGIQYYTVDTPPDPTVATVAPVESEAPAVSEAPAESEAPAVSEAPAESETPAESNVPAESEAKPTTGDVIDDPEPPFNMTTILIVAAIAVVAVILVVVVVMSKGKKKAAPAPAPAPAHSYAPPANGGFNAAPHTPAYNAPAAAGETTVLNQGAGETTVLSKNINGGALIRKRNGENININAERFVIGRERKNVNYCIADNSSISRSHVTLTVRNGVTYLVDMNAANGTYVNGVKAMPRQEIALKNGDKITLSDEEFEYRG